MTEIPVVYATDNNCEFAAVSIMSLLKNAAVETCYKVYIMIDDAFSPEAKALLTGCFDKAGRHKLFFTEVGSTFANAYLNEDTWITKPTYFRLLAPLLIDEARCIYLDTDTLVMTDLGELYNTPLETDYLAGVKAPAYIVNGEEQRKQYCRRALLPEISQYINAGVLLMNLRLMKDDKLVDKFLALVDKALPSQDQDILNSVCYGRIKLLPFAYNAMTKYFTWTAEHYGEVFSPAELKEAWNNPRLIHYADKTKPWNSARCVWSDLWWSCCRENKRIKQAVYEKYGDLIVQAGTFGICEANSNMFTKLMPVLYDLGYQRKYVVYGAGKRAKDVLQYLQRNGIKPEYIVVSKRDGNPETLFGIRVVTLQEAENGLHDKTVIVAVKERLQQEIIREPELAGCKEILPLSDGWEDRLPVCEAEENVPV